MTTATMTTKGQVTIPMEVRRRLGLDAGDRIEFVEIGKECSMTAPGFVGLVVLAKAGMTLLKQA